MFIKGANNFGIDCAAVLTKHILDNKSFFG